MGIGAGDSSPNSLYGKTGRLYFAANDGAYGTELWESDGTASSTVRVADTNPGSGSSNPFGITHDGRPLYFRADDGSAGEELWALKSPGDFRVFLPLVTRN